MKNFKGKVAVITGAASGIGRGIARKCVERGIKVMLADIEEETLETTKKELETMGGIVETSITDVSKLEDIKILAKKTVDKYGAIHLLFNNAGVSVLKGFMGQTLEDLEWILSVNLWGVIYGVKVFVPIMMDQNVECHIVNTASGFSFTAGAGGYGIAKHGVRVITEMMASELLTAESKIKVSMLIPGWVNTRILEAERNRPKKFINKDDSAPITPEMEKARNEAIDEVKKMVGEAQDPDEVADIMFEGIINEDLHIFTDFEMLNGIKERAELVTSSFKSLEKYWEKRKGS